MKNIIPLYSNDFSSMLQLLIVLKNKLNISIRIISKRNAEWPHKILGLLFLKFINIAIRFLLIGIHRYKYLNHANRRKCALVLSPACCCEFV